MFSGCNNDNGIGETTNDLKYKIRQLETQLSVLDEVKTEKNELHKRLIDTSVWIEEMVKKQKKFFEQLNTGHHELWCKYQNVKKDLEKSKHKIESANSELIECNNECDKLKHQIKTFEDQNKYLEEQKQILEKRLCQDEKNINELRSENENLKVCVERKLEEIRHHKETVEEQSDQLRNIQSELRTMKCKLELKRENYEQLKSQAEINETKMKKEKETYEEQAEIFEKEKNKYEHLVHEQKRQIQELNSKLQDSKRREQEIKSLMEKERSQSDEQIEKLKRDKHCLEAEGETLKNKIDTTNKQLTKLRCENEMLDSKIKKLQNKFEDTIKSCEEQKRLFIDEMQTANAEKNKLQINLDNVTRKVEQLTEELGNVKKLHKAELENVSELRRTIADIQFSQKLMPESTNVCSDKNIGLQLANISKVLDNALTDCNKVENISYNNDNTRNLEEIVKEINTISNSLIRSPPCN
ncbi:trichohyalin-like [Daktulosphaira vitifoliae]|uniref:trichohyalin-like n=1 Tax=Daktulosphaira vitifoliae TaxID=58002 RepID=UPI0021AAA087|nr:trichohyalin-like [Daktulosphaira vitifoliae]